MTTHNRVINYLTENRGGLTVKECTEKCHTSELRKIMSDLRDKGYKVSSIWETGLNAYGDKVRYKRYFLDN